MLLFYHISKEIVIGKLTKSKKILWTEKQPKQKPRLFKGVYWVIEGINHRKFTRHSKNQKAPKLPKNHLPCKLFIMSIFYTILQNK